MTTNMKTAVISDPFFREYTSQDAILKYTRATAGYGIGYLLDHDYKAIYLAALNALPPDVGYATSTGTTSGSTSELIYWV